MVIVKVVGGLGNQMFTYATGRCLAWKLGAELKLDISGYGRERDPVGRRYALDVFNIEASIATPEEIVALTTRNSGKLEQLWRNLFGKGPGRPASYVKERSYHFDPRVLELTGNLYLRGNWNSYKYFADAESVIRHDFSFGRTFSSATRDLAEKIETVSAVSLHVRRGDYVSDAKTNQIFGTCDLGYYHRCVASLAEKVPNPHFFLFSDDPEWVHENLKLAFPVTVVDHNGPDDGWQDMYLMSRCRHHIVANSGFSWWGAWLNARLDKIVYAPANWYKSGKYNESTLVPNDWVRR